jgi:hypothetical protein
MNSHELTIIVLNTAILLIAYLSVYPKIAGIDINKVAFFDIIASGLALFIVGVKYWDTDQVFTLAFMQLSTQVNWFWFTFISYALLEIPIALWYFRRGLFKR